MKDLIKIENLCKSFKDFSLKNVSFCVPQGVVVGFIGENGAGKSTVIKSILGLVNADSGKIKVFEKDSGSLTREDKNRIGVVLGETALPENLNLQDVSEVMKSIFLHWEEGKFFQFADRFTLPRNKKIKDFSRGMRQKTALAVALSHGAELLVLDEPTSGLDPVARDEILDILYDFMQNERHSILISSHILSDLEKLCDYIVFIHDGQIIFAEEKDALSEKYAIWRGSYEDLKELPEGAVISIMRGDYGTSALVRRSRMPGGSSLEHAGIEDIMLYHARGEKPAKK